MMKKLRFTKMHGISNDYVYISTFDQPEEDWEQLAIRLSDRRTGIGGDGIILVCPSDVADAKMRIFNADGSEGMMCGNGIRCVGKFVYDKGLVPADKTTVTIDTLSGIKTLELTVRDGKVQSARVDMGAAILTPAEIPVVFDKEKMIDEGLTVDGRECVLTAKEFELLRYLLVNTGIVLTREQIMEAVWGFTYAGESRTIDMHIKTLRHKLGEGGKIIRTVRGVGYQIGGHA